MVKQMIVDVIKKRGDSVPRVDTHRIIIKKELLKVDKILGKKRELYLLPHLFPPTCFYFWLRCNNTMLNNVWWDSSSNQSKKKENKNKNRSKIPFTSAAFVSFLNTRSLVAFLFSSSLATSFPAREHTRAHTHTRINIYLCDESHWHNAFPIPVP